MLGLNGFANLTVNLLGRPHSTAGRIDANHNGLDVFVFPETPDMFEGIASIGDGTLDFNHTNTFAAEITAAGSHPHGHGHDAQNEYRKYGETGQQKKKVGMASGKHYSFPQSMIKNADGPIIRQTAGMRGRVNGTIRLRC
jgi:hypothetical protein